MLSLYFSLVFSLCTVSILADNDVAKEYSSENFDISVQKNNHFVMFYAPWCGHCKRLHPVWNQLAEILNEDPESQVTIAKVDCTTDHELCSEHDVTGYPTLKFFKLGSTDSVKFRGTRDLPSLTSFINEQLGSTAASPKFDSTDDENGVQELSETNFDNSIKTGFHFVKFYAPWCGHCQKLAPTWDNLAEKFRSKEGYSISKVDCTVHRSLCNARGITGYPTLILFKDGLVKETYTGQRSLGALEEFVLKQAGEDTVADSGIRKDDDSGAVDILNRDTFLIGVSSGVSFVKFFAPWCGHCKRLAPVWTELAEKVKSQTNVRVLKVDCTQPDSKELCNDQEVEGFPTLFVYRDGEKISEYNGSRDVNDLYQFLSKYFTHDEL